MNYDSMMLDIINKLDYVPTILLHSCCAPCSSHCISELADHFEIKILYYNPNISDYDEYLKRKNEQVRFINEFKTNYPIEIIDCDYDSESFYNIAKGLEEEPERGKRCHKCYLLRMEKTASIAKKLNCDYFATTLTLSPHKDANVLNKIGFILEDKYNIKYLPSDFKKREGYKHSIELSKFYNLYRQDYCGCVYSRRDRDGK